MSQRSNLTAEISAEDPKLELRQLCALAFICCKEQHLDVKSVSEFLSENFPYYRGEYGSEDKLKRIIRKTLDKTKNFKRVVESQTKVYYRIDPVLKNKCKKELEPFLEAIEQSKARNESGKQTSEAEEEEMHYVSETEYGAEGVNDEEDHQMDEEDHQVSAIHDSYIDSAYTKHPADRNLDEESEEDVGVQEDANNNIVIVKCENHPADPNLEDEAEDEVDDEEQHISGIQMEINEVEDEQVDADEDDDYSIDMQFFFENNEQDDSSVMVGIANRDDFFFGIIGAIVTTNVQPPPTPIRRAVQALAYTKYEEESPEIEIEREGPSNEAKREVVNEVKMDNVLAEEAIAEMNDPASSAIDKFQLAGRDYKNTKKECKRTEKKAGTLKKKESEKKEVLKNAHRSAVEERKIRKEEKVRIDLFLKEMEQRNKIMKDDLVTETLETMVKDKTRKRKLFRRDAQGELTASDERNIRIQRNILRHNDEETDNSIIGKLLKEGSSRGDRIRALIINDFASITPKNYLKIGEREDNCGTLQFYDSRAKNSVKSEKDPEIKYKFISKNQEMKNYRNEHWEKAKTYTDYCNCDPAIGCMPKTCACMKQSVLVARKPRAEYAKNGEEILDCGMLREMSMLQRLHAVYTQTMGFGLRLMQPVSAGEPIVEFTGVHQNHARGELVQDWAYTTMNSDEKWERERTGISKRGVYFVLNPLRKGNSARYICHSFFPNTEFVRCYRGGMKTTDVRCIIVATEDIEAGQMLYLDYGRDFGITEEGCLCTQLLCNPIVRQFFRSIPEKDTKEAVFMRVTSNRNNRRTILA